MGLHHHLSVAVLATAASGLLSPAMAGSRWDEPSAQPSTVTSTVQARVISSTPIMGQVAVPRRVCFDELRHEPPRSNGAGALLGAIAGGAVGNAVGKGSGNVLATGLGIFGGAILGDHIQNDGRQGNTRTHRRCEQQNALENRVVAYTIVYEWAGQRYTTQSSQQPGRTIPVQITLAPLVAGAPHLPASHADHPADDLTDAPKDSEWADDDGPEGAYTRPARHHRRDWY